MTQKILFIVRTYCAPDIRVERETRALAKSGYNVETFCLWDQSLPKIEEWDGGIIRRIVYVPMNKWRSIPMKIWSLILFALITLWRGRSFDIIHCNDLDMLPIGVFLKWISFNRIKIVYDAHEYETERFHHDGIIKKIAKITERFFIRFADTTLTVSDAIADEYAKLYNMQKPHVVLNCPPLKQLRHSEKLRSALNISDEKIVFLYQGGLFPNRGIEMILDAFERLDDKNKVVIFMGFGQLEDMIKNKSENSDEIYFHPAVGTDVLHDYTSSADVGILYYENTCLNHYYCSPNKLFEYLMAGLPIVASNLFEMKRILEKNKCGFVTEENNASSLLDVIKKYDHDILNTQKENAKKMRDVYNWENQEVYFLDAYREVTQP